MWEVCGVLMCAPRRVVCCGVCCETCSVLSCVRQDVWCVVVCALRDVCRVLFGVCCEMCAFFQRLRVHGQNTLPSSTLLLPPTHCSSTHNVVARLCLGTERRTQQNIEKKRTEAIICIATASSKTTATQLDPVFQKEKTQTAPTRKISFCTNS